ncbi:VWA domain-containing protein [Bacteroidales bacterium OttesenSCG-928-B11]|nr:VWA domain-containing protein [Bacteroidales bacterium OttesenSCG-928-B11]
MFRFENEHYLWGLLVIPILVAIYIVMHFRMKKRFEQYGELSLLDKLMPERSTGAKALKFSLLMGALACFILTIANPQVGSKLEKGMRKGVDIMVCMDVSNSMLAEDIKPNRLEASKMAMSNFIDKLKGDRVGLVVFAGKAFTQLPITSDYAAAKMFINNVSTGMINTQGTDIAGALDLAVVALLPDEKSDSDAQTINNLTSKVIIVVSDGEDHFNEAAKMAAQLKKHNVTTHTIGIGSTKGVPIPIKRGSTKDYKKDRDGNTVITKLNENALKEIAENGGGVYVQANNANMGFESILDEINKMFKGDVQEITFASYDSKYQIPLIIGLIFLIIELLLFSRKPRWINWFKEKQAVKSFSILFVIFIMSVFTNVLSAQTKEELNAIREGNRLFNSAEKLRSEALEMQIQGGELNSREANEKMKEAAKLYQEAEIKYRKAMETTKNYDKANYNLGTSLYRQEQYEAAADAFKRIAEQNDADDKLRSQAYHNLGNSYMKSEKYQESVDAYKNSLKLNPSDMDTKHNLEYAKQKLVQQQQQQQQQQDQDQNQQDQDQQQNQGQQQNQQNKDQKDKGEQQNQQDQNQDKQQEQQGDNSENQREKEERKQQQNQADRQQQEMDKRQLDALQQNERKTQEKLQKEEQRTGRPVKQEKDW